MAHHKELVMYSRNGCPFVYVARQVLAEYAVPYREILITQDETAKQRVQQWTGFLSVPTLIVAHPGDDLPVSPPDPLPAGHSPRGVNRGSMITEPDTRQLVAWLRQHDFITS